MCFKFLWSLFNCTGQSCSAFEMFEILETYFSVKVYFDILISNFAIAGKCSKSEFDVWRKIFLEISDSIFPQKIFGFRSRTEEQSRNFLEEIVSVFLAKCFRKQWKAKYFKSWLRVLCISKMRPQRKCYTEFESFYICSHLHLICISLTVSLAPNFNLKQVAGDAFSI